jgi:hypothetical protein
MEHYALRLLQPAFAAPPGMRVIVLRDEPVEGGPAELVHEVRLVVGFQSQVIHHYTSNDPRPVHPDPAVMEKLGWHYKHQDCHCSPICVTASGRVEALNPDEPCWMLIDPDTRGERLEQLSKKLLDEERLRRTIEHRIEDLDQDSLASD